MNIRKIISGLLFAFTVTLFGLSFSSYWDALLVGQKIPVTIDYLIDVGFISATVLWFWMLGNFFQSGPKKARVAIGFAMLFFNIVAAPIYWLTYYVRQSNT